MREPPLYFCDTAKRRGFVVQAVERVMQAYGMMGNLSPAEELETRGRLEQFLAGRSEDENILAVEGLRFLRGSRLVRKRIRQKYRLVKLRRARPQMAEKRPTVDDGLDAQAYEALEAARAMPYESERSEALKRAGLLRKAVDVRGIVVTKRGRPRKDKPNKAES
jgi:hypothetical protein